MSAQIARLETLLARVTTRAGLPRPVPSATAGALDEQALLAEVPAAFAAPEAPLPSRAEDLDDLASSNEVPIDDIDEIDEISPDSFPAPESGRVATMSLGDAVDDPDDRAPLTPPPQSGEERTRSAVSARPMPTMEQLGETIYLDEGRPQEFELDEPSLQERAGEAHAAAALEAEFAPQAPALGDLVLPENAREELDRVRLGESTPISARVSTRPVLSTNVVEFVTASRSFQPQSFAALLDASLALK